MCDCAVVTPEASLDGAMLFAKNSDRERDEAQLLEIVSAADHAPGAMVQCTYVDVPQAAHTHRVLLSRPSWMWGAEIAVNEHGIAVGNEAVFTRLPGGSFLRKPSGRGLTGMDLVRLVAERADSAAGGVALIADLLAAHGQGGPGGYRDKSFVYHNSFLLADPEEAWVVETAGVAWVAKRVRGVRSISNALTLRDDYDRAMPNLAAFARDLGLHHDHGDVDFADAFADRALGYASAAVERRSCLETHLRRAEPVEIADVMAGLRLHGEGFARNLRTTVCAHASWLPTRAAGQTNSSLVAHLRDDDVLTFVTGTSSPCVSLFKPVWLDSGLPGYDAELWWQQYAALRSRDVTAWRRAMAPERDTREALFTAQAVSLRGASPDQRAELTARAFSGAGRERSRGPSRGSVGRVHQTG